MKIIGILGSPRKNGNSAMMLEAALEGAREQGAEVTQVNLFDLQYTGCKSCFSCKLLGSEGFGKCGLRDELTPVLEQVLSADGVILATPLYFGETPGAVRNFLERLWFPAQQYAKNFASAYKKRIKVGLIYTMNMPDIGMYRGLINGHKQNFNMLVGKTEAVWAVNTKQFDDYSKYASEFFDPAAKQAHFENEFPKEREQAKELGKRMAR